MNFIYFTVSNKDNSKQQKAHDFWKKVGVISWYPTNTVSIVFFTSFVADAEEVGSAIKLRPEHRNLFNRTNHSLKRKWKSFKM